MDTSFYLGACFGIFLMFVSVIICETINIVRGTKAVNKLKNNLTYIPPYKDK